jgi:hypothetical protein
MPHRTAMSSFGGNVSVICREKKSHVAVYMQRLLTRTSAFLNSIPSRGERIFPVASVSRPALGPTLHPVQWVPGVLSPG